MKLQPVAAYGDFAAQIGQAADQAADGLGLVAVVEVDGHEGPQPRFIRPGTASADGKLDRSSSTAREGSAEMDRRYAEAAGGW
jgi:hypothetical protein